MSNFDAQLHRSRIDAEIPIAEWFKRNGAHVVPRYLFSGDGAPKLEAFSASESATMPDLDVCRSGMRFWVEVKLKTRTTLWRNGNRIDTGIDLRHWKQYLRVREITGAKVFIAFAHESDPNGPGDFVTLDDSADLERQPGIRFDHTDSMAKGGMVFWPISGLTIVTTLSDVRRGRPPSTRAPRRLTDAQLPPIAQDPSRVFRRKAWEWFTRELPNNAYGKFRVLKRTDDLFVVHDTTPGRPPPFGPIFATEGEARDAAQILSAGGSIP